MDSPFLLQELITKQTPRNYPTSTVEAPFWSSPLNQLSVIESNVRQARKLIGTRPHLTQLNHIWRKSGLKIADLELGVINTRPLTAVLDIAIGANHGKFPPNYSPTE